MVNFTFDNNRFIPVGAELGANTRGFAAYKENSVIAIFQKLFGVGESVTVEGKVYVVNKKSYENFKRNFSDNLPDLNQNFSINLLKNLGKASEKEVGQVSCRGASISIDDQVEDFLKTIKDSRAISQRGPLSRSDEKEIREQLKNSLTYLHKNRKEKVREAGKYESGFVYITPKEQGFTKRGKFSKGGSYNAAHLQICKDGEVYLIPKHRSLQFGSGTSKRVRLGLQEKERKIVAAASIRSDPDAVEKEVKLIKKNHSAVAYMLYGPSHKGKVVLPYAQYGDLSNFINAKRGSPLRTKFNKEQLALGVIESVRDQHKAGIINRDIKLPNFLLAEEEGEAKVWCLDRGLSSLESEDSREVRSKGSVLFMAPECFDPKENSKYKVDIYSLGVTLWALRNDYSMEGVSDPLPWLTADEVRSGWFDDKMYYHETYKFLYEDYIEKHPEFSLPEDKSPKNLGQLVAWMTHGDPKMRPTIEEVEKAFRGLPNGRIFKR